MNACIESAILKTNDKKGQNTQKIQWKSIKFRKGIEEKDKFHQGRKNKLEGAQESTDWNKILIRDFEERQEDNQESTSEIFLKE